MNKWLTALALGLAIALPVSALTLDEARNQGLVGETLSGYLAVRVNSPQAVDLANTINAARATSYRQLALRNGLNQGDVARLAGQKLVDRAAAGQYVQGVNGMWLRK